MKRTLLALTVAALALPTLAQSQHYVQPHVTRDGTFVEGHMQTNPDGNVYNNWSTQGNTNPYTGQAGTVNPYQQRQAQPLYQPTQPMQAPKQCGYVYGQYVCR